MPVISSQISLIVRALSAVQCLQPGTEQLWLAQHRCSLSG
jgi:hypothetical protein